MFSTHSRRFREEPDKEDLEDRWETLEERGQAPRPGAVNAERAEGTPSGNDGTREPERVEDGRERRTMGRVSDLRDEERRSGLRKCRSEANHPAGRDEHGEAIAGSLHCDTDAHQAGTCIEKLVM